MAGAQARARLGRLAAEADGGTGVEDLGVLQLGGGRDLRHVLHQLVLAPHGHVAVADHRRHVLGLAALGLPFRQTAVEHGDVGLAHQLEQPPDPRRREQPLAVIDHDLVAVAHAHGTQPRHELLDGRHHVRQLGAIVADIVDVEIARAGNVGGGIFRLRIAVGPGQEPAGIEDAQVGILEMGRQPVGRDKRLGIVLRHVLLPGQSGSMPFLSRGGLQYKGLGRWRRPRPPRREGWDAARGCLERPAGWVMGFNQGCDMDRRSSVAPERTKGRRPPRIANTPRCQSSRLQSQRRESVVLKLVSGHDRRLCRRDVASCSEHSARRNGASTVLARLQPGVDQPCFSSRCFWRFQSRLASVSRLSWFFLPLAMPTFILAMPLWLK